jgi:tRNA threonylcarbamoyladenosine biosynthesis protein TsaB
MSSSPPRSLILETSGRIGQVAVAEGETIGGIRLLDEARRHARDLVPAVAELLAARHWQPKDVDLVVVSRGPGSYTGLRVGIISAKTFAYVAGCQLLAIETFAAIASQAPAEAHRVDVLVDAQQDKMYVQSFARSETEAWMPASPLSILEVTNWLAGRDPSAWVTGPGLRLLGRRLPQEARAVRAEAWDPDPGSLLRIALKRYQAGERDDFWSLEPLYLRPSSAEEKWQQGSTVPAESRCRTQHPQNHLEGKVP